jgi:energy-coupling factor transporter ATP-binding protein EcfA2
MLHADRRQVVKYRDTSLSGLPRRGLTGQHGSVTWDLEFEAPVERWVRVRDDRQDDDLPFDLDGDGFLVNPAAIPMSLAVGDLVRPHEAGQRGALVLLGEPGSGKTTTFRHLTGAGPDDPPLEPGSSGTLWITGSELSEMASFQAILGTHLDALPGLSEGSAAPAKLAVVLDQLDESPDLLSLPRRLQRALTGKDTRSLRILVACRTADYPTSLTAVLERALGGCVLADLAPLTRVDAESLAASLGLDERAFIEAVVDNGAGVLASIPLTLKVLIAAYRDDKDSLSAGPIALFTLGVKRLADEHDRTRIQVRPTVTSNDQRVVVAGRIAARLLLSGQRTVWAGESAFAGTRDVTEGSLSGGLERTDSGSFEVSPLGVSETLKTALFSRSGPNRIAFAHSSFAAFLAADYLTRRMGVGRVAAQRQLAGVFLVAAPDEDTASIPAHLRETAAWLLAHSPTDARWLASADPEGLMAHSVYITSATSRELIVEELLERAPEIELSDRSWYWSRWRLAHPGLADQLRPVLEAAVADRAPQWGDLARAKLAVRLARECSLAAVAIPLLDLTEAQAWPISIRQRAATAAMENAPDVAISRLRPLLHGLRPDVVAEDDNDELDELRGTLLSLLWPDHVELNEVIPHIKPRRRGHVSGLYSWQAHQFAPGVSEDDLESLLIFIRTSISGPEEPENDDELGSDTTATDVNGATMTEDGIELVGAIPKDVVDSVIDRVMRSPNVNHHLPEVARLIVRCFRERDRLTLPQAVDLLDIDGFEPTGVRGLRHDLAEMLIRATLGMAGELTRYHAYVIANEWQNREPPFGWNVDGIPPGHKRGGRQRLLDNDDFVWALERTDHLRTSGDAPLANAFGLVAGVIADLYDPSSFELAYDRRDTPEWEHLRTMYEGIPLDSHIAEAMRMNTRRPDIWEHADKFAAEQRQRLDAAAEGDSTAFWQLTRFMLADPTTGRGVAIRQTDDMRSFPGAALWPEAILEEKLQRAAHRYVLTENDHRETWLGTNTTDYRARAGYFALALLHLTGGLDSLPHSCWGSWAGTALNQARYVNPSHDHHDVRPIAHIVLAHVARYAMEELVSALQQLVRTSLTHGEHPWGISIAAEVILSPRLGSVLIGLAKEIETALSDYNTVAEVDRAPTSDEGAIVLHGPILLPKTEQALDVAASTWADLLHAPLVAANADAIRVAREALTGDLSERSNRLLAVAAGRALLFTNAESMWPDAYRQIVAYADFAQELADACSRSDDTRLVNEALTESDLTDAFLWLARVYPPSTEVYTSGFAFSTRHYGHSWRDEMLAVMARRGTLEAIQGIRRIVDEFPEDLSIQAALIAARRSAQAQTAVLLRPKDITNLLEDPDRRIARTALQLAEIVVEVLGEVASDLDGHANLLWDCERLPRPEGAPRNRPRPVAWRPKSEGALAAYLAHELTTRIQRRRIVINREVVVRPTDAGDSGKRPDLVVDAITPPSHEGGLDLAKVSVPIEVKGSWHKDLLTSQEEQLAGTYLPAMQTNAGVYFVGVYSIALWDAEDRDRKRRARKAGSADSLRLQLDTQAEAIRARSGKRVIPFLATITRAHATSDGDAKS